MTTTSVVAGEGDIYVASTTIPSTTLSLTTVTGSQQTVDLTFMTGDTTSLPLPSLAGLAGDTIFLTNAGDITSSVENILAGSILTLTSTSGSITGASTLGASEITLIAGTGIGTDTDSRLNVNAITDLSLTTEGADDDGDIYVASTTIPTTTLTLATDADSPQTIDLEFMNGGELTLPELDTFAGLAGDTISFTNDGGINIGIETIDLTMTLESISATTILTLESTSGSITGTGRLMASEITLSAGTGIGTDSQALNVNAITELSLETIVTPGNIYVASTTIPTTSLSLSSPTTSTVSVQFNVARDIQLPMHVLGSNIGNTLSITYSTTLGDITVGRDVDLSRASASTLTLTTDAGGISRTGDFTLTANTISLTATGIGAAPDSDGNSQALNVNAITSLSLTTEGADATGDIYIASTTIPTMPLILATAVDSPQTIDLEFMNGGELTLPELDTFAGLAGDTISFTNDGVINIGIETIDLTMTLESISATTVLTLESKGAGITGTGTLMADTISLVAGTGIGTDVNSRLNVNAITSLSLETTGAPGNIYVASTTIPSTTLSLTTVTGSRQTVDLTFMTGDATNSLPLPSLAGLVGDTIVLSNMGDITSGVENTLAGSILTLTSTSGSITGASILTAPTITLTAATGIGTDTDNRLNVNASAELSLTTTSAVDGEGDIYVASTAIPTMPLILVTAAGSSQTVDLEFTVTTSAFTLSDLDSAPNNLVGDDVRFEVSGSGNPSIDIPHMINLGGGSLSLESTGGSIAGSGTLTADTITFTAETSISGLTLNAGTSLSLTTTSATATANEGNIVDLGPLTAPTITLTAATGIGTDVDNRLNVNASESLSLTTEGISDRGDIYVTSQVIPNTLLVLATNPSNLQVVDLVFTNSANTFTLPNIDLQNPIHVIGDEIHIENFGDIVISNFVNLKGSEGRETELILVSGGRITHTGESTLTADTISLTAATGIGADTENRVNVAANKQLSLTTTGASANIYVTNTTMSETLMLATNVDSSQTVDLEFTGAGVFALPDLATFAGLAGDTISFTNDGVINIGIETIDLTMTLESISATTVLTLESTSGSITGSGTLMADTIFLTAATSISSLTLNANTSLSLTTTSEVAGEGDIMNLGPLTAPTITLLATGSIIGSGILTAPTISLTAAMGIGIDADNRLNVDASTNLSLETTGASGDIYAASPTIPATLNLATNDSSRQTVNLTFMAGDTTSFPLPDLTGLIGDVVSLTNAGDITITGDANNALGATGLAIVSGGGGIEGPDNLVANNFLGATDLTIVSVNGGIEGSAIVMANTISLTAMTGIDTLSTQQLTLIASAFLILETQAEGAFVGAETNTGVLIVSAPNLEITTNGGDVNLKLAGNIQAGSINTEPTAATELTPDNSVRIELDGNSIGFQDPDPAKTRDGFILNNDIGEGRTTVLNRDTFQANFLQAYIDAPVELNTQTLRIGTFDATAIEDADERPKGSVAFTFTGSGTEPELSVGGFDDDINEAAYGVAGVQDLILYAKNSAATLSIQRIGTDTSPVEDLVLHNFASYRNGRVQDAKASLSSVRIVVPNFRTERLLFFTSDINKDTNLFGRRTAPLALDIRRDTQRDGGSFPLLQQVSGDVGAYSFVGYNGINSDLTYGNRAAAALARSNRLQGVNLITFNLGGTEEIPQTLSTQTTFSPSEDYTIFIDSSVFLTFDLVVYSDESNASCASYTFEESSEDDEAVTGCL